MQCFYSHHKPNKIMAICLKTDCELSNRLVCFQCLLKEHSHHCDSVVNLEEISRAAKRQDVVQTNSRYFEQPSNQKTGRSRTPNQSIYPSQQTRTQEICELLNNTLEHLNETKIDYLFNKLKKRILDHLDMSKQLFLNIIFLQAKQLLNEKISNLKKSAILATQNLHQLFNDTYNLKAVNQYYRDLSFQKMSLNDFNSSLSKLLNSVKRQTAEEQLNQLVDQEISKLSFILDESEFSLQSDKIIHQIHELSNAIKNSVKKEIIFIKSIQNASKETQIEVIDHQQQIFFPQKWAMIYTNCILESGRYIFRIKLEQNIESDFYFGLFQEDKKDKFAFDSQSIYINIKKIENNNKLLKKITNDHQGEGIFVQGDIIEILIDFEQNQFKMFDSIERKNQIEYISPKIYSKQWRFFILDGEGRASKVTIQRAVKLG